MKKRLLLHIGYPKTATTTLQQDVFLSLHNQGLINYLGRTTSSTHNLVGKSSFSGEDWVVKLRRHLVLDEPLQLDFADLSEDKINVISDEDLTLNPLFNQAQFDVVKDTLEFPRKLKSIFGESVNVSVVLTIRKQRDLIYSGFRQKYRFIHSSFDSMSFSDFLFTKDGSLQSERLSLYDFNKLANKYKTVSSAPLSILLFEDLKHQAGDFAKTLGNLLDVEPAMIESLLKGKHRRKRNNKNSSTATINVQRLTLLGTMIDILLGKKRFFFWLSKRHHMRFNWWLKVEKKLFWSSEKVSFPSMTQKEEQAIFNFFESRNRRFAESMELDKERMQLYGYF